MRIYDHYGTCFECGLLTALNKNSLMCEDHDYEKRIESLEQKLKIAVEALENVVDKYFDIPHEHRLGPKHLKEGKESLIAREALEKLKDK